MKLGRTATYWKNFTSSFKKYRKAQKKLCLSPRDEISVAPSRRAFNLEYLGYPEAWLQRYALEELHFQL
jgi:hypothetical protein